MITNCSTNASFRLVKKEDEEVVRRILKDKTITKNVPFHPKRSRFFLVNGEIVGFYNMEQIHNCPEIQYAILKEYRNLNYGSFLLEKLTYLLFKSEEVPNIYLMIDKQNLSSIRVATKNGYQIDEEMQILSENADLEFPYYYFMKKNPYVKEDRIIKKKAKRKKIF